MVSLIRLEETILWAHAILTEEGTAWDRWCESRFQVHVLLCLRKFFQHRSFRTRHTLDLLMLMLTLFAVGEARQPKENAQLGSVYPTRRRRAAEETALHFVWGGLASC